MNDRVFSGGNEFVSGSMEYRACEIMMKSELRNGKGAYEIGNAGAAASGPSFGPFQYDLGANQDGRRLLESIAASATDAQGHRVISDQELESVKIHIYKPFNTFTEADRNVYAQMKPKLDSALSSDVGVRTINADFVPGIQNKVAAMNAVVDTMTTASNKTFVQQSDVAKLILIDTKNQYGTAVNDGLKQFIDRTENDPAMSMPGRSAGATIKVEGEFGLDDMIRYKLETQYGQNDRGAKDVLRRISHCIEAVGVDNVRAGLSSEEKAFIETGLETYLKDCGRNAAILDDPQLKAIAELGGREQHRHFRASHAQVLREGSQGHEVKALQRNLADLGYTDAHDHALHRDGDFGPATKAAVEKFQRAHQLIPDGLAGAKTLDALERAVHMSPSFADAAHPGNAMYCQALNAVHRLDAQHGRTPDQRSNNLAAGLAVAAQGCGMSRIDEVMLSGDACRAYAVQNNPTFPFKHYIDVNVTQAIATPLAQSSAQWPRDVSSLSPPQIAPAMQVQNTQVDPPAMRQ